MSIMLCGKRKSKHFCQIQCGNSQPLSSTVIRKIYISVIAGNLNTVTLTNIVSLRCFTFWAVSSVAGFHFHFCAFDLTNSFTFTIGRRQTFCKLLVSLHIPLLWVNFDFGLFVQQLIRHAVVTKWKIYTWVSSA